MQTKLLKLPSKRPAITQLSATFSLLTWRSLAEVSNIIQDTEKKNVLND